MRSSLFASAGLLAAAMILSGCLEDPGDSGFQRVEGASATTEVAGRSLRVVTVENEPFGHIMSPASSIDAAGNIVEAPRAGFNDPPFMAAIRIEGVGPDDFQTALRAFAQVCGFAFDDVKDWGAYGDPLWQDPRDLAVVLYGAECPPLKG